MHGGVQGGERTVLYTTVCMYISPEYIYLEYTRLHYSALGPLTCVNFLPNHREVDPST